MDGSSKILTVSYGTFSCTLEGFDDPLGTMRDLAEYFRDLAADDRYFGAEPPTPDVEMLQSIAQRDIHRKVEARTNPTGIALTQTPDATTPAAEETSVAAKAANVLPEEAAKPSEPVAHDTGPLAFDDDFLMADEPEDILAIDPDAAPSAEGPAESVAEKLRRIRAVVSHRPSEDNTPFSEHPSPEGKRNRAMTRTIDQIQYDLSDDEDAPEDLAEAFDDVAEVQAFEISSEDKPLPKAEDIAPSSEHLIENNSALAEPEVDNSDEYEDDDAGNEPLDMSQFLENVSEKIGETNDAPPANESASLDDASDADVGRLLEETDSKLNEDGVVRRRQVISQMRAAVAATKADRAVSKLISPEAQDEAHKKAYRNDLSDAVSQTTQLPTPKSARKPSGPPLVLVSSQRVAEDNAQSDNAEAQQPQIAASIDGFAEFVATNDAQGLDELLEAAAAYTIFAKGQESFSRPEIMKRVAMVDPSLSVSREDGLRSFGQLLRQGKFQKLDRGQFTIDQDTRFNPENRIAGE